MPSTQNFICRVSSTLNNDVQNYGKKFMFDDNEETCWNSSEGSPQFIEILFKENQPVSGIVFQFQGGFVGQDCVFEFYGNSPIKGCEPDHKCDDFYPQDINGIQTYVMKTSINTKVLRIVFNSSTDTYGRIILYKLMILNDVK